MTLGFRQHRGQGGLLAPCVSSLCSSKLGMIVGKARPGHLRPRGSEGFPESQSQQEAGEWACREAGPASPGQEAGPASSLVIGGWSTWRRRSRLSPARCHPAQALAAREGVSFAFLDPGPLP